MFSKRILHGLAVLVTILLFLIRRALIKRREHLPIKKKSFFEYMGYGDTSETCVLSQSPDCVMCMTDSLRFDDCNALPKYKKDPDIKFDDEDIGKYPREY